MDEPAETTLEALAAHDRVVDLIEQADVTGAAETEILERLDRHAVIDGWVDRIHPSGKTLLRVSACGV